MIHSIRAQTGRSNSERCPRSETFCETWWLGNVHHGWMTAKKSAPKRKPYVVSETESRVLTPCSAIRM